MVTSFLYATKDRHRLSEQLIPEFESLGLMKLLRLNLKKQQRKTVDSHVQPKATKPRQPHRSPRAEGEKGNGKNDVCWKV